MQNPLFPTSASNNQALPDYLQTGSAVQPGPGIVHGNGSAPMQPQTPANPLGNSPVQPPATFAPASLASSGPNDTAKPPAATESQEDAALSVIRNKVAAIYADEPDAQQELAEVTAIQAPLSKHQQYMQGLHASGKSPADIQAAWYTYYAGLSDTEKHEVWHEFYAASPATTNNAVAEQPAPRPAAVQPQQPYSPLQQMVTQPAARPEQQPQPAASPYNLAPAGAKSRGTASLAQKTAKFKDSAKKAVAAHKEKAPTIKELKKRITDSVSAGGKLQKKHHLQSLFFGLGVGTVVVFIFLFSFFNEIFLSPFIQPSRTASETPVIVDPANATVGQTPKVIIPKINVEIPVDYSVQTANNAAIEAALDNGIVHYPTTVKPGQAGNAAFFGHSSNNIFNPGKYKFAFVLLHKLVEGDTFYITNEGKTYAYQVISRRVVEPTEVSVLGPVAGQTATATLITCDPPGTSLKRLVVVGKQISPDPAGNPVPAAPGTPGAPPVQTASANKLAGNGPTLWGRIWQSVF